MNTNKTIRKIAILAVAYIVIFAIVYFLGAGAAWFVTMDASMWLLTNWDSGARFALLLVDFMFCVGFTLHLFE